MSEYTNIVSFFKHKTNKIHYSQMEEGDIAFFEQTGEYIMGGYKNNDNYKNIELDLIVPKDENFGRFIVFASLLERDLQLTIKADTEVLREMFYMPHSHLLRKNHTNNSYDIVEPTIDISSGEIIFLKIGTVSYI